MFGKKFVFFILCIINIVIVFKIFDGASGVPVYKELGDKIDATQQKIDAVDAQNRQISAEIRILKKDEKYVQRLVKRELFYLSDNELMYIIR